MARGVVEFWLEHGVDTRYGGFLGTVDAQGKAMPPDDKGLIQQTRHLWALTTYASQHPGSPGVAEAARDTYEFIVEHFLDPSDGEFYYSVSRRGEVRDAKKLLYAESFAIYALATYASLMHQPTAYEQALACFRSLDARTHDAEFLGYDQRDDPGWLSPPAEKGTNTHIHLLESFTALYRAGHDPLVRERLAELVQIVVEKIRQPPGYAHQAFQRDWAPVGETRVSYGHDVETSWLLLDALEALGKPDDPAGVAAALEFARNSGTWGYDAEHGGYFEEGVPGGAVTKVTKVWWVQAEALPGLFRLYQRTGEEVHWQRLEGTLAWIQGFQKHPEHAEWYREVEPDGSLRPGWERMGDEWKASYHTLRALLFTSEWIRQELGAEPSTTEQAPQTLRDKPLAGREFVR